MRLPEIDMILEMHRLSADWLLTAEVLTDA
jgi:hypothetical protein